MGFSDLGCYGGEIETPTVDKLASEGVRFTNFYNCAKCSPSRSSLLTGLYHQAVGTLSDISKPVSHTNIPGVLQNAGYRTCMVGKQHGAGQWGPWDREFRVHAGCFNFFAPDAKVTIDGTTHDSYTWPADFYTTDAFTDHALKFIGESTDRPFFLYMAYNAPHYPMHARPEDIAKYRGRYDEGYDVIRSKRFAKQKELGIADSGWSLSKRDSSVRDWSSLSDSAKSYQKSLMEVYAAMVDRMDQNIGRVMAKLRETGQDQNTLVLFVSDNGAIDKDLNKTPGVAPGPAESYHALGTPWSNVSNTPFRKYKKTDHEGGICTPLVAWWGNRVSAPGSISRHTGHLIDIMATCVELAGAEYPADVTPMEGTSLVPVLEGTTELSHPVLFWQYLGDWRAIRQGKWKALKLRNSSTWYLFDLEKDRAETTDVSSRNPGKLGELKSLWDKWKANSYTTEGWNLPPVYAPRRGNGARPDRHGAGVILQDSRRVEVRVEAPGHHRIRLATLSGKNLHTSQGTGQRRYVLDRSAYAPGWYSLEVVTEGEAFTEQVFMR